MGENNLGGGRRSHQYNQLLKEKNAALLPKASKHMHMIIFWSDSLLDFLTKAFIWKL